MKCGSMNPRTMRRSASHVEAVERHLAPVDGAPSRRQRRRVVGIVIDDAVARRHLGAHERGDFRRRRGAMRPGPDDDCDEVGLNVPTARRRATAARGRSETVG